MIGGFIVAWVKQDATVTSLIGSGHNCRIYPQVAPQNAAYPRLTYQVIASDPGQSLTGPISLEWATVQIDCWGGRGPGGYAAAYTLAEAIAGTEASPKLDGYYGTLSGYEIRDCHLTNRDDGILFPTDGSDNAIHSVTMDFDICFVRG